MHLMQFHLRYLIFLKHCLRKNKSIHVCLSPERRHPGKLIWKYCCYCNFTPAVAKITISVYKNSSTYLWIRVTQYFSVMFCMFVICQQPYWCLLSTFYKNYSIKIKYLELSSILLPFSTLQSPGVVYLQFLLCSGVADWQLTNDESSFLD